MAAMVAVALAAAFASAAIYINVAEHPARLGLADGAALAQWHPSYKRGFMMQGTLAVASSLAGVVAWWAFGGWLWPAGAALMLANWPFTLLVIMPVNHALEAMLGQAHAQPRALLVRWGQLHGVRSLLGCAGTLCYLIAAGMR